MIRTEFVCQDRTLVGEIHLPEGDGPFPAVILAHGFADTMQGTRYFAEGFAKAGYAAFCFDFIGGSMQSASGGSMEEMSVLTEAEELTAVLAAVLARPDVDPGAIFLLGQSQGGFVASYVASQHPQLVRGLIAFFPAYVLQDEARERVSRPDYVPGESVLMGVRIGACYDQDALRFDIYEEIRKYDRPVLLLHGTRDFLVPLRYSERALQHFPQARLVTLEGAGHGFLGAEAETAMAACLDFVRGCMEAEA